MAEAITCELQTRYRSPLNGRDGQRFRKGRVNAGMKLRDRSIERLHQDCLLEHPFETGFIYRATNRSLARLRAEIFATIIVSMAVIPL